MAGEVAQPARAVERCLLLGGAGLGAGADGAWAFRWFGICLFLFSPPSFLFSGPPALGMLCVYIHTARLSAFRANPGLRPLDFFFCLSYSHSAHVDCGGVLFAPTSISFLRLTSYVRGRNRRVRVIVRGLRRRVRYLVPELPAYVDRPARIRRYVM